MGATYKVKLKNVPKENWQDYYYTFLEFSWPKILLIYIGFFLSINALFAFLYRLEPASIQGAGDFLDFYFFSIQTFSTVGYGVMAPMGHYAHILVTMETMMSFLSMALTTGLVFAKFSLPKARLIFSRPILLTTYQGKPTLMLRVANARESRLVGAQMYLSVLEDEWSEEGFFTRRFRHLKLDQQTSPTFALSWTIFHRITPESPLYQLGIDEIQQKNMEFFCTIIGTDSVTGQSVHAMEVYPPSRLVRGKRFKDVITLQNDGTRLLDFTHFHHTEDYQTSLPDSDSLAQNKPK